MQPPQQHCSRCRLDNRIQTEPQQCGAPGEDSSRNRNDRLGEIPAEGQVLERPTAADELGVRVGAFGATVTDR